MRERMVIGVCTFNRGPAITRTLEALAALDSASGRVKRIVVVNNASTDDTARVVDEFARTHPESRIERIDELRPGKIEAMRRLFAATDEEVVGIVDDDTIPSQTWGEALLSLLDAEPRAGIVGGPVSNVWEAGPTPLAVKYHRSLGDQLMGERRVKLTDPMSFLMGASLACRRAAVIESGWLTGSQLASRKGSDLECGAEDAELCYRIRKAGWEVWYEPRAAMGHLIPARRQTVEYLANLRGAICRGEPALRWVAGDIKSLEVVRSEAQRAAVLYWKSLLFDWRPTRRRIRVAERRGKLDGWRRLAEKLSAETDGP